MSATDPSDLVSTLLMALGTLVLVISSVGSALPRLPLVRLHYLGLATLLGAPLVILGALVHDPGDWFKLTLIVVLLVATSPVMTAAIARAITREEPPGSVSAS